MPINSRISIGHDSLSRHMFAEDFFVKNPQLTHLQTDITKCQTDYQQEAQKKGCTCRVSSNIVRPCVDKIVAALVAAKENNVDCVIDFIRYIAKREDIDQIRRTAVMIIMGDERHDIHVLEN
jgi:hypothetical protein